MAEIPEAYVFDALRTPRGRGKASGSLYEVKPVSLVVGLIDEMRARHPELDTSQIDDVVLGVVSPLGDQGGDIAKTAAIAAGLPDTVAGVQLNRFCASGLEAVNTAALKVRSGMEELVLAGGVEVMSRVPMGSDGGAWAMDPDTSYTTGFVPQGIGADLIATLEGFTREDVDTFAVESQTRAAKAWANGYFAKSVVPVKDRNGPAHPRPRRAHPRGRHPGEPGGPAAVVRDDGRGGRLRRRSPAALPLGREDRARPPRGQQLRHRRRRRARPRRQRSGGSRLRAHPARPDPRHRAIRRRPDDHAHRAPPPPPARPSRRPGSPSTTSTSSRSTRPSPPSPCAT
jgi:hypothetical protein